MPRRYIKRHLPDPEKIRNHRYIRVFGSLLHDPNLWHLNKRSVSGAVSVGLFCAFIPAPMQMLIAAAGAILFRVNLPISVVLVWLTNPLTIPPMFYFAYRVGAWLMGMPPMEGGVELTMEWVQAVLETRWQPLLLGSFVVGSVSALVGNLAARGLWRLIVVRSWRARRARRRHNRRGPAS